jgi:hypothetical protein
MHTTVAVILTGRNGYGVVAIDAVASPTSVVPGRKISSVDNRIAFATVHHTVV